jgi:hypothetical protein
MRLSFDDEDSLKGAIESLRFDNPPSVTNTCQQIGSNMPLHESGGNEDNIIPSGQNTLWRVGSSSSVKETRRSHGGGDIQVCFNNFPSNPEYTSDNGM